MISALRMHPGSFLLRRQHVKKGMQHAKSSVSPQCFYWEMFHLLSDISECVGSKEQSVYEESVCLSSPGEISGAGLQRLALS